MRRCSYTSPFPPLLLILICSFLLTFPLDGFLSGPTNSLPLFPLHLFLLSISLPLLSSLLFLLLFLPTYLSSHLGLFTVPLPPPSWPFLGGPSRGDLTAHWFLSQLLRVISQHEHHWGILIYITSYKT